MAKEEHERTTERSWGKGLQPKNKTCVRTRGALGQVAAQGSLIALHHIQINKKKLKTTKTKASSAQNKYKSLQCYVNIIWRTTLFCLRIPFLSFLFSSFLSFLFSSLLFFSFYFYVFMMLFTIISVLILLTRTARCHGQAMKHAMGRQAPVSVSNSSCGTFSFCAVGDVWISLSRRIQQK